MSFSANVICGYRKNMDSRCCVQCGETVYYWLAFPELEGSPNVCTACVFRALTGAQGVLWRAGCEPLRQEPES